MCLSCGCDRTFTGTPTEFGPLDGKPTTEPKGGYEGVGGTK